MSYPEVYVLRHGETAWNAEHRMQGWLNSALTARGIAQAQQQAEILGREDLSGFEAICSPLGRCLHTAALAVTPHMPQVRTDPRLREIHVGDWQGKVRHDLPGYDAAMDGPDGPLSLYGSAPGGETYADLAERCQSFLDDLSGPTIIVTHGITSRMLRLLLLGHAPDDLVALSALPGGQGVVYHIDQMVQRRLD